MSVKLVNISKVFKDPKSEKGEVVAVSDVNLEINEGEMVTLLGPSGCGKTTTLRIVSGFETPTTGEVWISGENVTDVPPNKRDTSMVFQSYAIFPHLSVGHNIGFGLELKGWKPDRIREEVMKIMEVMNLTDMYDRRPDQLSGGQQQRVALARAIINRPSVLLFDEPLSNLDAKLREQMRIEIRKIQQAFKITSIYVTHDQAEAMTVSDRIVVMNNGKVMQVGTPYEIYMKPANWFVADFIGRVNFIEGKAGNVSEKSITVDYGHSKKNIESWSGSISEGDEVLTVIRPESLKLSSNVKNDSWLFTGKVSKTVYLGPTAEYEIEVKGLKRPIEAVIYNPAEVGFFKREESVTIDFNPKTAHLLKKES